MDEEIEVKRATGWKKAIPEGLDRWQSQVLVWVVGGLLVLASVSAFMHSYFFFPSGRAAALGILAISIGFATLVLVLRAATPEGALFGGMICWVLMDGTASTRSTIGRSGIAPLALLFVLTFLATRAGRRVKAAAGLAERRKGRSAAQVIANLSVAGLSVSGFGPFLVTVNASFVTSGSNWRDWVVPAMMVMCLAALVEATADTVSSEIGQAFGGRPVMLLSLRRVEPGTDGAVTVLGSFAGITAGTLVAAVGMWGLRLSAGEAGIALAAGVSGLFFDSLLGGTVERWGWLGNDVVNFASTVFAAGVALALFRVTS